MHVRGNRDLFVRIINPDKIRSSILTGFLIKIKLQLTFAENFKTTYEI